MNSTGHWNALYVKANCEGKVSRLLKNKGIKFYCPHNSTPLEGSQEKWINAPLFRSIIFVQVPDPTILFSLRSLTNVINIMYWQQLPAMIPAVEMDALHDFIEAHETVQLVKKAIFIASEAGTPEPTSSQFASADHIYSLQLPTIGYTLTAEDNLVTSIKLVRKKYSNYKAEDIVTIILVYFPKLETVFMHYYIKCYVRALPVKAY